MTKKGSKKFRSEIYTNLSELQNEVEKRWEDKKLRKKVDDFFGKNMLSIVSKKPRAMLSRSIGTPNVEMAYFLDLVKEINLDPLVLEYPDKFVAKNKDKYHLCRLFFFRMLKNGRSIPVDTLKVIDFNKQEGKIFSNIKTFWEEKIVDFHHFLLSKQFPKMKNKTIDFSEWFKKTRGLSKNYYFYFLSLFVCHGVLFENFLIGDKEEDEFIKKKFLPSFKAVEKMFGVKPLIYPLLPFENEKERHWLSYPESVKKVLDRHIKKQKNP